MAFRRRGQLGSDLRMDSLVVLGPVETAAVYPIAVAIDGAARSATRRYPLRHCAGPGESGGKVFASGPWVPQNSSAAAPPRAPEPIPPTTRQNVANRIFRSKANDQWST